MSTCSRLLMVSTLMLVVCGCSIPETATTEGTAAGSVGTAASPLSPTVGTPAGPASSTVGTTSGPSTLRVARTVYLSALQVDVNSVSLDPATGELTVDGSITNGNPFDESTADILALTPVRGEFGAAVRAEVDHDSPVTPAGSSSPISWHATVGEVDLADGRLVFGAGDANRSTMPFGSGEVETVVPVHGLVDGLVVDNGAVRATVATSVLRSSFDVGQAGHRRLDLAVDVTGLVDRVGGYRCNADHFELVFADGSRRPGGAPEDGHALGSVLGLDITADGWVSFDLTDQTGPVTLTLTTSDYPGSSPASVPVTLP